MTRYTSELRCRHPSRPAVVDPSLPRQLFSPLLVPHSPSPSHRSPRRAMSHVCSSKSDRYAEGHSDSCRRFRQMPHAAPASHIAASHAIGGGDGGDGGVTQSTRRYTSLATVRLPCPPQEGRPPEEEEPPEDLPPGRPLWSRRPPCWFVSLPGQLLISVVPHSPSPSHNSPGATRSHVWSCQSDTQKRGHSASSCDSACRQMPHDCPASHASVLHPGRGGGGGGGGGWGTVTTHASRR